METDEIIPAESNQRPFTSYIFAILSSTFVAIIMLSLQLALYEYTKRKERRDPSSHIATKEEYSKRHQPRQSIWKRIVKGKNSFISLYRVTDYDILEKRGFDTTAAVVLVRMYACIMAFLAIIILPAVHIPLNYGKLPETEPNSSYISTVYSITWLYMLNSSRISALWIHVTASYFIHLVVVGILYAFSRYLANLRQFYVEYPSRLARPSSKVLVADFLPQSCRSDTAIRNLFAFIPGGINSVIFAPDCPHLLKKIEQAIYSRNLLEKAETEMLLRAQKSHDRRVMQSSLLNQFQTTSALRLRSIQFFCSPSSSKHGLFTSALAIGISTFIKYLKYVVLSVKTVGYFLANALISSNRLIQNTMTSDDYFVPTERQGLWRLYMDTPERPSHFVRFYSHIPPFPFLRRRVDTIFHSTEILDTSIGEVRKMLNQLSTIPPSGTVVIIFKHHSAPFLAAEAKDTIPALKGSRLIPCVPPDCINWQYAHLSKSSYHKNEYLMSFIFAVICLVLFYPLSWIGLITEPNASNSGSILYRTLSSFPNILRAFLCCVMPPWLLSFILFFSPLICWKLSKCRAHVTEFQQLVSMTHYCMLILAVQLWCMPIATNAWAMAGKVSDSSGHVFQSVVSGLPQSAESFIGFVSVEALSIIAEVFAPLISIFLYYFIAPLKDVTPRERYTRISRKWETVWNEYSPLYGTLAVISLAYSAVCPIILLSASFSFFFLYWGFKYHAVNSEAKMFDMCGSLLRQEFYYPFAGLYINYICDITLVVLLCSRSNASACLGLLVGITVGILCLSISAMFFFKGFSKLHSAKSLFSKAPSEELPSASSSSEACSSSTSSNEEFFDANESVIESEYPPPAHGRKRPNKSTAARAVSGEMRRRVPWHGAKSKLPVHTWNGTEHVPYKQHRYLRDNHHLSGIDRGIAYDRWIKPWDNATLFDDKRFQRKDNLGAYSLTEQDILIRLAYSSPIYRVLNHLTVWIPSDDSGVSLDEIHRISSRYPNLCNRITNRGAILDIQRESVIVSAPPPDDDWIVYLVD